MEPPPKPRYIVAQTGARRGYAVPAILEEAGMLEHFYTDVCGNVGWGRWLASLSFLPGSPSGLKKLAHRRVPDAIRDKTSTFASTEIEWCIRRHFQHTTDPQGRFRSHIRRLEAMGHRAAKAGFGEATHLFMMLSEFGSLMSAAHEHGLVTVSEVYIILSADAIQRKERDGFPEWEPSFPSVTETLAEFGLDTLLQTKVDHFICPSATVADDLVENWGARRDRVHLVPYGMSPSWLDLKPEPEPGRVLFVGSAILRKGIHYLAMAAEELHRRGRRYEFRVAGHVEDQVRNQPLCRYLTFLDRVPRNRVHEEFQRADVFTLPTLAEGSAEVTYEAMAAALPLVTTTASGSVATDGVEGRIVPERDPIALADAIESIVEDRRRRNRMAEAARSTAADYTWDCYGQRLTHILESL